MRPKPMTTKAPAERVLKDIRRATRRHFSAEDKIRIVLDGLRGEDSIAELCRREGIAQSLYYVWSKEFLEAGKRRLAGDTAERRMYAFGPPREGVNEKASQARVLGSFPRESRNVPKVAKLSSATLLPRLWVEIIMSSSWMTLRFVSCHAQASCAAVG